MPACRSCSAPIVWATLNGKPHPFDAAPTSDGRFVIIRDEARQRNDEDMRLHRELFTSHFATCVDAEQWRRRDA